MLSEPTVIDSHSAEVETGKAGEVGGPGAPARHQSGEQNPGDLGRALALARLQQDARCDREAEHGERGGHHDREGALLSNDRAEHN